MIKPDGSAQCAAPDASTMVLKLTCATGVN
jgi:hypothetical protein